jgi:hypothetical protein
MVNAMLPMIRDMTPHGVSGLQESAASIFDV